MKVLFYNSKKIGELNILWGFIELGIDITRSELVVDLDIIDENQVDTVSSESVNYDFVITRNFSVNVAEGCHISHTPYISWCYDSPVKSLYCKEALYKTNYVFVFDKMHLKRLKSMSLTNVYYQPLAANILKASKVSITDQDIIFYDRDVSFVGSMYNKGYYEAFKETLTQSQIEDCERLFERHLCKWDKGQYIFNELSDDTVKALYHAMSKENRELYSFSDRYLIELLVLVIELTSRERISFINASSKYFKTIVHTHEPEKASDIVHAIVRPPVDELSDELYKIYASARININLTMRSIETGVPQRVFDIMSVGGCVFTNYQEEAEELFEPDKEIVLFKTFDEFREKADFYIKHDKERLELGARAYLKVKEKYNYASSIKNILTRL